MEGGDTYGRGYFDANGAFPSGNALAGQPFRGRNVTTAGRFAGETLWRGSRFAGPHLTRFLGKGGTASLCFQVTS